MKCRVLGCTRDKKAYTRRSSKVYYDLYCSTHRNRLSRYGDVSAPRRRAKSGEGHVQYNGYVLIQKNKKRGYQHRLVWEEAHGPIPKGCVIHHKDGDLQNNSIDNLELMTASDHGVISAKARWGR